MGLSSSEILRENLIERGSVGISIFVRPSLRDLVVRSVWSISSVADFKDGLDSYLCQRRASMDSDTIDQ